MKLAITILSDIHFKACSGHPILARAEQIASAISTSATELDLILVVLAGDIANFGLAEEFEIAKNFLDQLKARLNSRVPRAKIVVIAVPGNHDCFLPKEGENHRKSQVEASAKTVQSETPDIYYLKDLLSTQDEFWKFANANTDVVRDSVSHKICYEHQIQIGEQIVQLNLMNSSLLSQRTEDRGGLIVPVPLFKQAFSLDSNIDLSISILHHPPFWIEPSNMTTLRQVLNRVSDAVITGHQHFSSTFSQAQSTGEALAFYESPALYDPNYPQSSAFRVLLYDLSSLQQKELGFRWKNDLYRNTLTESQSEWKPFIVNRSPRYAFDLAPEHLNKLSEVGVAYVHPDSKNIQLNELFVYPDIRLDDDDVRKNSTTTKGDQALQFLSDCGVIVLRGGAFSGKTALSKSLCLDANALLGKTSILLDGREIENLDPEGFQKLLTKSLKKQYREADIDAYLQLPATQRIVVVDNWHIARLNSDQRSRIYKYLASFTASSVLIVDELFQLRQIVIQATSSGVQVEDSLHKKGEIIGLSYVSRGKLIHKWYQLRKDSVFESPQENNAAKVSEDQISRLLGKDNLPPYAFFILCMLQAQESKNLDSISGGSFGHYHEVLVVTTLTKNQSQLAQLDRKVAFCSEIAHYMWKTSAEGDFTRAD